MGQFSDLQNLKSAEAVINQSIKDIAKELGKIDKRLDKLENDFSVGIQIGQNASAQKYALASTVLKMSAAPACFIPFCGPIVATVLTGVSAYIDPGNTRMNLGAGVIAAVNRTRFNTPDQSKNGNPLLDLMTGGVDSKGNQNNPYIAESVGKVVWYYGDFADTTVNLYKTGLNVGKFHQAIKIIGKLDAAKDARRYQIAIEENVKETVDLMHQNQATFLPIIFWKLCESKNIKGHGTTLMNSLDLREGKDFDGWVKIEDAKAMLSGNHVDNKVLGEFANQTWGSNYRALAKKDFIGTPTYNRILGDNQSKAVTPIYIEKLRLFSYRQRFSESLKSDMGGNFLTLVNKYDDSQNKLLSNIFYAEKLNQSLYDCDSLTNTASKSVHNADQFRRREIYSWYCFHQILRAHLGTFILSSLPTLGTDPSADVKIMFAVIDAVSTAWWATTRAFNASGNININQNRSLNYFRISRTTLKKIPYISKYFDPVNIFYNYLTQFPEMQGNYQDSLQNLRNSINNLHNELDNVSIRSLMPGNNNITGLENWPRAYIEGLYSNLTQADAQDYYNEAMNKIASQNSKIKTYDKNFHERYAEISTDKSISDITTKYRKLVAGIDPSTNVMPAVGDIELDKLANDVANVHMGSLVSANATDQLTQAEFNRSVARALKSLVTALGKRGSL